MYILIILWLLFVLAFLSYNVYGIIRILAMRIKGDFIPLVILVYLILVFVIIFGTVLIMSRLNWNLDFIKFLHLR